jgi:4-methyl-5(b-hydroxyethyl)-thiazole monophosphate biosynthesis
LPGVTVSSEAVVRDGKVLTSRGPGTAMDFALALVEALVGAERRQQVEAALVRP